MMQKPTLCMIHEGIGDQSAIAKIAKTGVEIALDAGWKVTVVAKILDESLRDKVEWLPLYVPSRLFLLQWATARYFIRKALAGRTFDVVHAYQPQVAALADVFNCQFLTRTAYERRCLEARRSAHARFVRAQQQGALYLEDFYYRHWNPHTQMLYCSDLVQQEFERLYGAPERASVLSNSCPPIRFASERERAEARARLLGPGFTGTVLGYLGGVQERKGYTHLIEGLRGSEDVFLLLAGQYTDDVRIPWLEGRYRSVGLVSDTAGFYAACDVFVVPSLFDPCPLVVFEAASRGVPVIATDGVGNLPTLLRYGAGEAWDRTQPLGPLVQRMAACRDRYRDGTRRMAEDLSEANYGSRILELYNSVLQRKRLAGRGDQASAIR